MSLTSLNYIVFLIVCVAVYWLLPGKMRKGVLLVFSLAFYLYAMPGQLVGMLVYLWAIYALSVLIAKRLSRNAKWYLTIGIAISVLYLFFYKYLNFTMSVFTGRAQTVSLIVPMGISYITFQCIAYLVMIYQKKIKVLSNPAPFFLYCLFFPKVTSGPIEAPDEFFQKIRKKYVLTWKRTLSAVLLIVVGFAKKCVVADLVAPCVNSVFASSSTADGLSALSAILLYSMQILFDFSGYTDIALGSARLFGIQLTENFDHPYRAGSIVEFWRRWHISLSRWLTKYVFIPLGGSRVGNIKRYRNIMIVFLVSGIWHGASMTFVFWGVLHGFYQIAEILILNYREKLKIKPLLPSRVSMHLARVRTFMLVLIGWTFFRADSIGNAFSMIGRVFTGWARPDAVLTNLGLNVWVLMLVLFAACILEPIKEYANSKKFKENYAVMMCVFLILLVVLSNVLSAGSAGANNFIYFNF